MKQDRITIHDQYAAQYDAAVIEYGNYDAEIVFGLSYEFVHPQESLLDIGIGTGLGSQHFARAGLDIFGVDGSAAMLQVCRAKGFAKELKQFDLEQNPWPYADASFNHAIACGLFHFFGDLAPLFAEVARLVEPEGIFAFTVMSDSATISQEDRQRGFSEDTGSEITIYRHSADYLDTLLTATGFTRLKLVKFLVWSGRGDQDNLFHACVARKLSPE